MAIIERLKEFIKTQGLNNSAFEKRAGLGNGYISKVKGSPSPEKCEDILKAFPELSREWLFTGRGEMLNPTAVPPTETKANTVVPEASPAPEVPGGSVILSAEAWDVIKKQAASLERRDLQMDRVISMLEDSLNEQKKMAAHLGVPSGLFAHSSNTGTR